ncbi:MAG TPA: tripartite tricarboxylate transporter substrate binding protein [Burkholderiales bacterium]|nr:tripartite tricarboxylate transporter substrate binding protein [Burkholderiales bacterium]
MSSAFARVRLSLILAASLMGAALAGPAAGQAFPSKPIEFVAHTSPGGGTDLFARSITDMLAKEKIFSQPFVIGNRTGGSGSVAFNYIKSKRGDPHFVLTVATGTFMSAQARTDLGFKMEDFTPLALFAQDPQAIAVRTESKYKSFKELVEAAKKAPDTITAAIASATGTGRIALYLIERETGARFKYVSFKSGGDAVLAVLGGHVDITPENMSEMLPLVEGKKMRVLAVTGERRFKQAPDVPTLKEQGLNIIAATGRGFAMPGGVPKDAAAAMEKALKRVHDSAAYKEYSYKNMFEDKWLGSAEFTQYLIKGRDDMGAFLKHIGLLK